MDEKQFERLLIDTIRAHFADVPTPPAPVIHASWEKMKLVLMEESKQVSIDVSKLPQYGN